MNDKELVDNLWDAVTKVHALTPKYEDALLNINVRHATTSIARICKRFEEIIEKSKEE